MKSIGLTLLALAPAVYGFIKGEELRQQAKIKASLYLFFQSMRTQIALYRKEQKAMFCEYSDPLLEKIGFLPELREEVKKEPCLSLNRCIQNQSPSLILSPREKEALNVFSENFGMQSHTSQLADFDALLFVLKEENERIQKDLKDKIKLNRAIGITAGLGIYIMLI